MASLALLGAAFIALVQYSAHSYLFLRTEPQGHELGSGLMIVLNGFMEAALLGLIVAHVRSGFELVRPLLIALIVANLGHAILALKYFFPLPALFDAAVAVCLIAALLRVKVK